MLKIIVVAAFGLALAACTTFTFDNTGQGKLSGELMVVWVGEDKFVYVGGPNGLEFTPSTPGAKPIKPTRMYTDGGSIPRALRSLKGFSPWGYAPAYIIHDWLFIQRHCDPAYLEDRGIDFRASARILAEVTKVLIETRQIERNDFAFEAISWGVSTSIARRYWDEPDQCTVSPEHMRKVEEALRQERSSRSRTAKSLPDPDRPRVVFRTTF